MALTSTLPPTFTSSLSILTEALTSGVFLSLIAYADGSSRTA
jgi:hypothetical protein